MRPAPGTKLRARAVAAVLAALAMPTGGCESRGAKAQPRVGAAPVEPSVLPQAVPPNVGSPPATDAPLTASAIDVRVIRFAWRPPGADEAAYAMSEPEDQHRIVIVWPPAPVAPTTPQAEHAPSSPEARRPTPVLIALHGQPKRGQSPRGYTFPQRVIDVTSDLVRRGDVQPLVVVLPVFRFRGLNWPAFDLVAFRAKVDEVVDREGFAVKDVYVVGHSGAAGCGGDGMNRAHRVHPAAVGFFDTCLGAGWRDEVRALERARVPTSILQSVETAGVQPRHLREYDGRYDFGSVFRTVGLAPVGCPARVPDAPFRSQPEHCSADEAGIVRAFLVDTGEGETAHNALVGVALSYFLREHLGRAH